MDDYCSMPRGFKEYTSSDTPPSDEILRDKNILFKIIKNSVDSVSTRFNIQLFYDILFYTRQLPGLKFYYNSVENGDTPFHAAIRQGNRDVLYHLFNKSHFLDEGNDVAKGVSMSSFSVKNKGDIPLRLAIKLNFEVDYILDLYLCHMGLDEFLDVTSNPLPLIHLLVDRPGSIYRILKRYQDVPHLKLIEKLGASIQDQHGNTILHLLVNQRFDPVYDRVRCFESMLTKDLLAVQNEDGNTPVHLLCIHGYFDILKDVMDQCQDIFKLQNKDGNTLLHLLCMNGNVLLKDVLEYDTDEAIEKQNKDGNTPLHLALLYMNHDIHTGMNMAFDILKLLHENAPEMVPELLHMPNHQKLTLLDMITTKIAKEQEKLTKLLHQCLEEECIKDGEFAEQQEIVSKLKALKPLLEAQHAYSNDESAGPRNRQLVPFPVPAVSTTAPVVPGVRNGDSAAGPGGKRKTKRKLKSKKYKSKKYK
jgi:ankyrin repeat protein